MTTRGTRVLTDEQLASYERLGFLHSIPVLSDEELRHYRDEVDKTCEALGGCVTRLDGLHLYFRWAWDLSTNPRLLDCMECLLGSNIVLKSTRLFCKHGNSSSYVGWHQDGYTEGLTGAHAPAIWLGLTEATVENGCLRVVPRSHRLGPLEHDSRPDLDNLTTCGMTDQAQNLYRANGDELSGRIARIPPGNDSPWDLVMRPGEMSLHHPLVLHGSNANRSSEPRIGLSATYSTPEPHKTRTAVAWVRGDRPAQHGFEVIAERPNATFKEAVAAYRASDCQILYSRVDARSYSAHD